MLRSILLLALSLGCQAVLLSTLDHNTLGPDLILEASEKVKGYTGYIGTYCPGQDELGNGQGAHTLAHVKSLEDCAATCSKIDICNSFEFDPATNGCRRSSTCTTLEETVNSTETNLYVRKKPKFVPYKHEVCIDRRSNTTLDIVHPATADGCSKGAGCSELEACADLCDRMPACVSFEFKQSHRDTCDLHSACTNETSHITREGWDLYVKTYVTGNPPGPPEYFVPPSPPPLSPPPSAPPHSPAPYIPPLLPPSSPPSPPPTPPFCGMGTTWNGMQCVVDFMSLSASGYCAASGFCKEDADKHAASAAESGITPAMSEEEKHTLLKFTKSKDTYCEAQDELGTGQGNHTRELVKTLEDCANTCLDLVVCTSFEWDEKTATCTRSTTCTLGDGKTKEKKGTDLYAKKNPMYTPYYETACHDGLGLSTTHPSKSDGCGRVKGSGCSEVEACSHLCTRNDECISFEYKHETNRCVLSKDCTLEKSDPNNGGWNLYVKKSKALP